MPSDRSLADPDDDTTPLRPAWEDTADETDADRGVTASRPAARRRPTTGISAWPDDATLRDLLAPLASATDALARLDARTAGAAEPVRAGLLARMALAEAAGWLAHAHAWVHPLDLALRDAGLTASTALAFTGLGHRALPQTFGGISDPRGWSDAPFDQLADGDRSLTEALALSRVLPRLPGHHSPGFADAREAAASLHALGAEELNVDALADWWRALTPTGASLRRASLAKAGEGYPPLPPLLAIARAAEAFMDAAITTPAAPALALLAAMACCHTSVAGAAAPAVFVPVWAAGPAIGFGDRSALPSLRSDAADRLLGRHGPLIWPLAFLHLVAESARMAARQLDRLEAAAGQGRGLTAGLNRSTRLPDALEALLRAPVLTPKALAARLRVAPQTATALLRELQGRGLVKELTGRERFRAFAI
jgi:hypothetical protein